MTTHRFGEDGFEVVPTVLSADQCDAAIARLMQQVDVVASRSLLTLPWCIRIAQGLKDGVLSRLLAPKLVAVQCTYFEKSSERNWLVPIHQNLSIPVRERVDDRSLRGWSQKDGALFVQPPIRVLEQLVAVRLHLDPCASEDGPLRVVPGSHRQGRISPAAAVAMRADREVACTTERGAALVMRPLLLHASSKATGQRQRRVLHFVFGPPVLPHGLRWQHAI